MKEKKEQIAKILDIQPDLLIFDLKTNRENMQVLDLVTISPNPHRTKFLFHTTVAATPELAVDAMFDYVNKHMQNQDNWQIRWHNPKTKEVEVSWFRAASVLEALDKFYHDKEKTDYKIYEVSLRPYA